MKMTVQRPTNAGVALILTLGFLAIIAVLAVAFAVTMRVERLAAASYADGVRARQLAHTALARALRDIHQHAAANNLVFPEWVNSSFPSTGTGTPSNFLVGSVTNYIPASLIGGARARAGDVRWVNVSNGGTLVGRYAYLAINCSGLLDPNADYSQSGPPVARKYGLSPLEIAYNANFLTELGAGTAGNLLPGRIGAPRTNAWRRAESVADLWIAGFGNYPAAARPLVASVPVANLFPFSYYPAGFRDGNNIVQPINIAVSAADLAANQTQIAQRLQQMGLPAADAATVAANLVDYVDADVLPQNPALLDTFSAEPVPMLNEIVIENQVTFDSATSEWKNRLRVRVELFYPFAYPTTASGFTVQFTVEPVGGDFPTTAQTETGSIPAMSYNSASEFHVHAREFEWTRTLAGTPAMPTGLLIRDLSVRQGANVVDRVRTTPPIQIPWNTHFHNSASGAGAWTGSSWAVDDPRINWDWNRHWNPAVETKKVNPTGSLNAMNPKASFDQAGRDGHRVMYARNGNGAIEVPGEVAFLLYSENRPWQTIPLYGPNALPVLDHFTTVTNEFRTGLVNVNTTNRNVLAQIFFDAPLERYPGETGAPRITVAQANALANAIYSAGGVPNQYTNVSHIARAGSGIDSALSGLDTLQKKAAIRNTSMLMGTRQNIYTIVITAQSVRDANNNGNVENDEVVGEQRAVAVVWRDPYPVNGLHNTFVRFFRWLDD